MKKRLLLWVLILALSFAAAVPAFALDVGLERVTIGANLSEEQRAQVYRDLGVTPGSVTELTVTNQEEREYLEGLVSDGKIGKVALSSVYIKTLEEGEGLKVTTNNINWCSKEMYVNALMTAGITDAEVRITAPFEVSGTAALTGLYKSYEDITGTKLDLKAKSVAVEEIVVTGNLAEMIGDIDATELVNQLKLVLEQTKTMSDDEVRNEIKTIAKNLNISLTDGQIKQLLDLCRSMEGLDSQQLAAKVESLKKTLEGANKVQQTATKLWEGVKNVATAVGNFFSKLFK